MSAIQGARERARREVTAAIKEEARRQLGEEGAARLSLRAVARELGMVSSALYRYFPSRDELLTALIIDAYDALGAAAEQAHGEALSADGSHLTRWLAVCRAVRAWALEHPHEYALIYGSPVPGYSAPQTTTTPASRVGLTLLAVFRDAHAAGLLTRPGPGPGREAPPVVREDMARLAGVLGSPLPAWLITELVIAWAQLFGLVNFELFGHFEGVVGTRAEFFDHAAARLAAGAGLTVLPGE